MELTLPAYGWAPRTDQLDVWAALEYNQYKTIIIAAHRRYGKDELALANIACKAMERVGSYFYCLPEYSQARKTIWDGVNHRTGRTRIDDAIPKEIIERRDNQMMFMKLKNGSTIQLVGSDSYDALVGSGPVGIVFSEAALADPAAWGFMRPMLLESNGWSMHISTPRGKNHFHRMVKAAEKDPTAKVFIKSATDTQVFTAAQLANEKINYVAEHGHTIGEALFAQEYLCSFEAAIVGAVWGAELTELRATGRLAPCQHDPRYPVCTSWDLGIADDTVVLFWQQIGNQERLIDYYADNSTGLDHYVKMLKQKDYVYDSHYAPHDISNREWGSGMSRIKQAADLGLIFKRVPNTPKDVQLSVGAQLLRRAIINSEGCDHVMEALAGYKYRYDESRNVMSATPVHDWTSHYADAMMTYALARARNRDVAAPTETLRSVRNTRLRDMMQTNNSQGAWG